MQVSLFADSSAAETHEIRIADGNFATVQEFETYMNSTFFYLSAKNGNVNKSPLFDRIVFSIDSITGRAKFVSLADDIFFACIFYDPSLQMPHQTTLGWALGFRLPFYPSKTCMESECMSSIFCCPRNLFLSVNDYQYNNNNNNLVLLGSTMLDDYILAQYTLPETTIMNNNNYNYNQLQSFPRIYNGPVSLKKLSIKVYNEDGNVIDLNGLEFSFTLELTTLYENFNFH